jgi:hypothetical protein
MNAHEDDEKVYELLEKVGQGELNIELAAKGEESPLNLGCFSDVVFLVGDWKIVIFFDGGDFDYIDSVISPEGRKIEDWPAAPCGGRHDWFGALGGYFPEGAERFYASLVRSILLVWPKPHPATPPTR